MRADKELRKLQDHNNKAAGYYIYTPIELDRYLDKIFFNRETT